MIKSKTILSRGKSMYKVTLVRENMASLREGCKVSMTTTEQMRGNIE